MKAVVWRGGQTFRLEDVAEPRPGPGQVLVKVGVAAICGSDYHLEDWGTEPPVIPGHEASGTVVELGSELPSIGQPLLRPGDRVALDPVQVCGGCYACSHGIPHLCTRCRHLGTAQTPGTWAEYVAVDARNAHRLPASLDLQSASLTEPAAVCLESFRRSGADAGKTVVIIGDGPFGFFHAQIARVLGARAIVVAGHHDERLERIRKATAALVCNTHREQLAAMVRGAAGDDGVDIVIEASGSGDAPGLGLPLLRPRGKLVLFSYVWKPKVLDMGLIHMRELELLGSCRSLEAFDTCIEWMARGSIDAGALLDLRVPFGECERALADVRSKKATIFKAALIPAG
jgi:threonine dehydrogenase-like Zn-dependent dehydrogenase